MKLIKIGLFLILSLPQIPFAQDMPEKSEWLREILLQHQKSLGLPALGASVVVDGKIIAASVVGVRKYGDNTPADLNDRFHIGSIAKPITVTMLARFIEQGFFHWDDKLEDMFPDLAPGMYPDYLSVTIDQLVSHTSGMPYQPTTPESETDSYGNTVQLKRRAYVIAALKDPPEAAAGTKRIYGGGHILAAHFAEGFMGLSYEDLMLQEVFNPLEMTSARFGPPATPGKLDSPWEHVIENGQIKPIAPDQLQFHQARAPVGRNLSMSIIDLGKFSAIHLLGARGTTDYLKADSFQYLHSNYPGTGSGRSWAIGTANWARGKILYHSGSTLKNFALCHIVAEENFAICIATNIWHEKIHDDIDKLNIEIANRVRN